MGYSSGELQIKIIEERLDTLSDLALISQRLYRLRNNHGMPKEPSNQLLEKIQEVTAFKERAIKAATLILEKTHVPNVLNANIPEGYHRCNLSPAPGLGLVSTLYTDVLMYHHQPKQRTINLSYDIPDSICFIYDYFWSGSSGFGGIPHNDNEVKIFELAIPFEFVPSSFQLEEVATGTAKMDRFGKCFK